MANKIFTHLSGVLTKSSLVDVPGELLEFPVLADGVHEGWDTIILDAGHFGGSGPR